MQMILGNRDIGSRKLGNLQYFDVPSGAFPVPWGKGKECSDPEKCSKNALQGNYEGVSAEEYRRRQAALRPGMGFTKQELVIPVGGAPQAVPTPGIWTLPGFTPAMTPTWLYPVTTPQPTEAPSNGPSTKTLIIGGAILLVGITAVAFLTRG
jgi:hypothetical protein